MADVGFSDQDDRAFEQDMQDFQDWLDEGCPCLNEEHINSEDINVSSFR